MTGQAGAGGGDTVRGGGSDLSVAILVGTVLGDPNLGMFGYVMLAVLALVMLPIVMALVFTVWAGTRPTA